MANGGDLKCEDSIAGRVSFANSEIFAIAPGIPVDESNTFAEGDTFAEGHTGIEGNTRAKAFAGDEARADTGQDPLTREFKAGCGIGARTSLSA